MATTSNETSQRRSSAPKKQRPLLALLSNPLVWPWASFELTIAWIMTRRWLKLLLCLPVLIASAFLGISALRGLARQPRDLAARYLALADKAEADGDSKIEEIYYRKLATVPLEPTVGLRVAKFLASHGRMGPARVEMQKLAPAKGRGMGEAHLWLAMDGSQRYQTNPSPELARELIHHAKTAVELLPNNADALLLYGNITLQLGQIEQTLALLGRAAEQRPEILLELAALQQQTGNYDQAKRTRAKAAVYLRSELVKDPRNPNLRFNLTKAIAPDGQIREAIEVLREGLSTQDSPLLRSALADCLVLEFDTLSEDERENNRGIALLNDALYIAPNNLNLPALERIAALTSKNPNADWGRLKDRLQDALIDGTAPAIVHLLLANGHLQRKEFTPAKNHLEQACKIDPKMVFALNNLAWVLAFVEPADIERAEQLSDQAAELFPNHLEVRETRGQIKLKQKKYRDAIADLEIVQGKYPDREKIREALAEAYEGLGDTELAEKYRQRASESGQTNGG